MVLDLDESFWPHMVLDLDESFWPHVVLDLDESFWSYNRFYSCMEHWNTCLLSECYLKKLQH